MLTQAKIGAPQPGFAELISPVFSRVFDHLTTLIAAPEGYLHTDCLASLFVEKGSEVIWIRFGPEDCDPGTLLLSLVDGAEKVLPGINATILSKMRRQPGPVTGWEPIFTSLAMEINRNASSLLWVLEGIENFGPSSICLRLLTTYFLELLGTNIRRILISNDGSPKNSFSSKFFIIREDDLRLDERSGKRAAENLYLDLSENAIRRALTLSKGKVSILASLKATTLLLGSDILDRELKRSHSLEDLLNRIVHLGIRFTDDSVVEALAMSLNLGYNHTGIRSISQSVPPISTNTRNFGSLNGLPSDKNYLDTTLDLWHQPLENGWGRLRGYWQTPLHNYLMTTDHPKPEFVRKTVMYLLQEKAICAAINLCMKQKNTELAAEIIAKSASEMMDLGQWATVNSWIKSLYPEERDRWPILEYVSGKIITASGNVESARKTFAHATQLYARANDPDGECRSLQAESTLAAWRGETTFSKERALTAFTLAQHARLTWHEIWAGWHLGTLAIEQQNYPEALDWFSSVGKLAKLTGYHSVWEMIDQVTKTLRRQCDLDLESQSRQQALITTEIASKENLTRLQNLTNSPSENLDELLEEHGWMNLPLIPITSAWVEPIRISKPSKNFFAQVRALLNQVWEVEREVAHQSQTFPQWTREDSETGSLIDFNPSGGQTNNATDLPDLQSTPLHQDQQANELRVRLLGQFRAEIDGVRLDGWAHNRVCGLFKYLLINHSRYTPRELLMETFWPDSTPEAARNSMNVTLHNLRRILRFPDQTQAILFHEGGYRLNPSIAIWMDIDEFEFLIQNGRQLEDIGKHAEAITQYEAAFSFYQGDFLSEDPYDDWTVTQRERLRTLYLDTLDRLSQIYYAQGDFNTCVQLCQRIINGDVCREDVHRRIMRCYSRLDQNIQAIRHYHICVEALKNELDVAPEVSTRLLYEQIRHREQI